MSSLHQLAEKTPRVEVISRESVRVSTPAATARAPQGSRSRIVHTRAKTWGRPSRNMNLHAVRTAGRRCPRRHSPQPAAFLKSRLAHRTSRERFFITIHALKSGLFPAKRDWAANRVPVRSIAKWLAVRDITTGPQAGSFEATSRGTLKSSSAKAGRTAFETGTPVRLIGSVVRGESNGIMRGCWRVWRRARTASERQGRRNH